MLKLLRNNQNIHRDILLLGIITLQHVIQNNCRWVWWYSPLPEDQENFKEIYQSYLVALIRASPMLNNVFIVKITVVTIQ